MNDPVIAQAIADERAKHQTPKNWICLTDAELYALLAGVVPESVKLAAYELTDQVFEAKLIQNSERVERPKPKPKRQREVLPLGETA